MPYATLSWRADAYHRFLQDLQSLADPKYKAFHTRLCKTSRAEILGVRTPDTKRIAKEIAKGDADAFLALCGDTYYEELLIKGFVLGFQKKPLADKRENLDAFVLQIDNWAVCDGFCAALKPKQTEYPYLYDWCCALLQTKGEYTRRTAIVLLMDYLLCDEYIDRVLEHLRAVRCDCYYVCMAVAWCLSMSFVRYREKTLDLLLENAFDKETHNKAIQKCIDSYRVSAEDKAYLRTLKR